MLTTNNILQNTKSILRTIPQFIRFKPVDVVTKGTWFIKSLNTLKPNNSNPAFKEVIWYPCLFDNLSSTPVDATYFYQDTWAAGKIFEYKPQHHYDIGSAAISIGIISQFVPTTMVDIRPLPVKLPNLHFIKGSILNLPFEDNSIESLSSLCVVEHIGLGRYGDPIDAYGSEKAIIEIKRVMKKNGTVLISLPIDNKNKIYFNAHRAFTREYVLKLFEGFTLEEEHYQYGNELVDSYDKKLGFGTGLFMFTKI